jgi:hypothetical protein
VTQINLPNRNITGDNLWSQVEDNDQAITNVVNGDLDNGNIKAAADINASKLLDGSITADKLGTDSVTATKLKADASTDANRPVTTNHIRDAAVTAAKLGTAAVTTAKIDDGAITTAKITNGAVTSEKVGASSVDFVSPETGVTSVAGNPAASRKFAQGLIVLQGVLQKNSGSWTSTSAIGTIPAGYRPSFTQQHATVGSTSTGTNVLVRVTISTAGVITANIGSGSPFSASHNEVILDGITFYSA